MIAKNNDRSRAKSGCLIALLCFSIFLSAIVYPIDIWWWFIVFGLHALVSLFLRVGWVIPFTMAGIYFGIIVLDAPGITGGTWESRMEKTVTSILAGTVIGFGVGYTLDKIYGNTKVDPTGDERNPDEPSDAPVRR